MQWYSEWHVISYIPCIAGNVADAKIAYLMTQSERFGLHAFFFHPASGLYAKLVGRTRFGGTYHSVSVAGPDYEKSVLLEWNRYITDDNVISAADADISELYGVTAEDIRLEHLRTYGA